LQCFWKIRWKPIEKTIMLIEILGEFLVEGIAYGTYSIMDLFLDHLYKGWNKTLKKILCVLMGITLWVFLTYIVIKILEFIL